MKPRLIAVDYEGEGDVVSVSYRNSLPRGFFSIEDRVIDVSLDPIILDLWEKSAEFYTSTYAEDMAIMYQYEPGLKMDLSSAAGFIHSGTHRSRDKTEMLAWFICT